MSIVALTSDTLVVSPGAGQIEYNGQFYGTDSNASRAQMQRLVLATSQASTSGTSIDFTSIPSWAKRITVMFSGVSLSGTSSFLIQLGTSGGVVATGYSGGGFRTGSNTISTANYTTGFGFNITTAAGLYGGNTVLTNVTSNSWSCSGVISAGATETVATTAGNITLGATLNRVRITTVNGTDTFDAGSINILYEG
jgi:hypothetical protein